MAIETGLQGQRVLITGAPGGIGDAIAELFAAEGCRLVLHANSREWLLLLRIIRCLPASKGLPITSVSGAGVR